MARRRPRRPAAARRAVAPSRTWAIALLAGAGAAGGLVYNVLSPRGIFAPVPVATDFGAPAPAVPAARPTRTPTGDGPGDGATASVTKTGTGAQATPPPAAATVRVIDVAEAESLARQRAAVFVDARTPEVFAMGHIPRAVNVPSTDFAGGLARNRPRLNPEALTVVYCTSEECDMAEIVMEELKKAGFTRLLHYKAGWNAWENAGLPAEK